MAVKLQDAGIGSFTIFEKASEVGGTWRDNTFPGSDLRCAFQLLHLFVPAQPGLVAPAAAAGSRDSGYFRQVADERGIRPHIGSVPTSRQRGTGTGSGGSPPPPAEEAFDVLDYRDGISARARGTRRSPAWKPAGPVFHSSRWDHSVSLPDKRIGLIGTGSTGVQITAELGGKVRALKIFQRTAQWVYPWPNPGYPAVARAALRRWPRLNQLGYRFWGWFCENTFGVAPVRPGWQRTRSRRCAGGTCGSRCATPSCGES